MIVEKYRLFEYVEPTKIVVPPSTWHQLVSITDREYVYVRNMGVNGLLTTGVTVYLYESTSDVTPTGDGSDLAVHILKLGDEYKMPLAPEVYLYFYNADTLNNATLLVVQYK